MAPPSRVIEAIHGLLPPLLAALERVAWVQRHFHPPEAGRLADALAPDAEALAAPLRAAEEAPWPDDLRFMHDHLLEAARGTVELAAAFVAAARAGGHPVDLYRALRRLAGVQETLYPLAPALDPVSRWFLEPDQREDEARVARLREGTLREGEPRVGILHSANERGTRGGFSLYVPEHWDGKASLALVVALHGGHGHGRDFLWSWLRAARSRGVMLLAPTSQERTWSIMGGPDVDAEPVRAMVEFVAETYPVDRARVLLTGMSDGATYALLCGLTAGMPFTHLAPACGVLHPMLLADGRIARAHDRPVYLVHGALDWMFPVHSARMAREALGAAGARLVYREIADLSHTYPREEHPRILDWLRGG